MKITQAHIDQMLTLKEEGKSSKEIAAEIGCGRSTVYKYLKGRRKTDDHVVTPQWVNKDILVIGDEVVYRYRSGDNRYYYTFDEMGQPMFHIGVTSALKVFIPPGNQLEEWKARTPDHEEVAQDRADYGTVMHVLFGDLLLKGQVMDEDVMFELVLYQAEKLHRSEGWVRRNFKAWRKDMLALAQWIIDYQVEPLAVEIPLADHEHLLAGCLDFPCVVWDDVEGFWKDENGEWEEVYTRSSKKYGYKKGDPKKTKRKQPFNCIVDFKSGRKGFYESNEYQLAFYKHLFEVNFPNVKIDRLYNWSPKEWRDEPGYNFRDQTEKVDPEELKWLLDGLRIKWRLGKIKVPRHFKTFGTLEPGTDPRNNYRVLSAAEYVTERLK